MDIREIAEFFRGGSDPSRVRILIALTESERRVGELEAELGAAQACLHHHLKVLRMGQVVLRVRRGRQVTYALTAPGWKLAALARELLSSAAPPASPPV